MNDIELECGEGRGWVHLRGFPIGPEWLLVITNSVGHLGSVAVAEYDPGSGRASASVITAAGHRDDLVAKAQAQALAGILKRRTCVVAGIHIDNPTDEELRQLVANSNELVRRFLDELRARGVV